MLYSEATHQKYKYLKYAWFWYTIFSHESFIILIFTIIIVVMPWCGIDDNTNMKKLCTYFTAKTPVFTHDKTILFF